MAYPSRSEMETRWARLRELADGTRTLEDLAKEVGTTYSSLRKMALKDPTLKIRRATRSDLGADRDREVRFRRVCKSPLGVDKGRQPCGTCDACERNDEEESEPVERCPRCEFVLPHASCIGTVQDYMYGDWEHVTRRGDGRKGNGIAG